MKRRVARLGAVFVLAPAPIVVLAVLGLGACGRERTLAAAGEDCDLAVDCVPGLVCIEQRGGSRVCSNDLSRVEGDVPPDGASPAEDDAGDEGGVPEGGEPDGTTPPPPPPPDAGTPDTGSPPPQDAAADG